MDHTPTNTEVADVFEQLADILERQGENTFKIRAYRNAVRTLEELLEPAADINARGELKKIPGFGDAIVGKTKEILATGTCDLYERLKAEEAAKTAPPAELSLPSAAPAEEDAEIESPW
jgi:DNA polymerase (family 10)